jgi:hypothetical protein
MNVYPEQALWEWTLIIVGIVTMLGFIVCWLLPDLMNGFHTKHKKESERLSRLPFKEQEPYTRRKK